MQFCSFINFLFDQSILAKQIKSTHAITSIKQSPVFKGHLFNCPVIEDFIWIELLLRVRLSYKAMFSLSQKWPLDCIYHLCIIHVHYYMYLGELDMSIFVEYLHGISVTSLNLLFKDLMYFYLVMQLYVLVVYSVSLQYTCSWMMFSKLNSFVSIDIKGAVMVMNVWQLIYNHLCNHCLSPLKLWVLILNIMW